MQHKDRKSLPLYTNTQLPACFIRGSGKSFLPVVST
ncbi:hypothetical protein FQN60_008297 [Etheostoma spectabile]|uniref:Uncharacterized protein n=1 Tax=Etheostoma spectabile TaxID=54343 RepID=A0A5J5CQY1_9PERO|nr:hypothetical protein FQN60_008297 [Etheostoma spectabile]